MTTLTQFRTLITNHLEIPATRPYSSTEMNRWINECARDIARKCENLQDRDTIVAVAGTQEYAVASDVLRVFRVEYVETGLTQVHVLEYRDFNSLDSIWGISQVDTQSTPRYYTLIGYPPNLKIVVYPKPAAAGAFKLFMYRLPAEATADGDTVDIPTGWDDMVLAYAEMMVMRKKGDQRWVEAKQMYDEKLDNLFTLTRRYTDQGGSTFGDGTGTALPAWLVAGDDWGY